MTSRYAVILCGGSGTRLWPLSRSLRPKQLLPLNGDESLLQQTARRLLKRLPADHLLTVTHEDHKFEVKGQLTDIAPELAQGVLAEPCARNTLPAIAWAVSNIHSADPQAVIGIFPSDHAIGDEEAFLAAWQAAETAAEAGYLTLIGITPTEPATGYGYIQTGEPLLPGRAGSLKAVKRFVEKPDMHTATDFVKAGYLWNGGMFIFRADRFMQMLAEHQPKMYEAINRISDEDLTRIYEALPSVSMDYGLVEKAEKVAVVPASMDWSDLGNWNSIYQRHEKNAAGNITQGNVVSLGTQDSLLWSTGGLLATLGLKNIAVIQTPDATLVCDRARTEEIKRLVADLEQTQPEMITTPVTVHRPWGTYTVLEEGTCFKIKRIKVNPGAKLSMQMHHHRSEHWVVVSGTARITNGEREILLQQNESTYIPKMHRHRLENPAAEPLHIIEVQCGEYVGEDDIVRFEDTYGRS